MRPIVADFPRRVILLLLLAAGLAVPAARAAVVTKVFQQGRDGFAGVRDTWVSRLDWDTPLQYTVNYGQNENLALSRDGGENPLLRIDLSAIPANSAVITATLSLYNTTRSSYDGTQNFARRVRLFRVLRDWDEGNQTASPVDAPGDHGATGDFAFRYYPGEGPDVPWSGRGMAEPADYPAAPESYADVVNEGWYQWDVTTLVSGWVRAEYPNFGLVLRDATGYEDNHRDWRTFVSSQAGNTSLRPILTVVYNPDVPYADAGPDQENLGWTGGPITLDGSRSHDRPGGNDQALTYTWRIAQAAYGSALSGQVGTGASPLAAFAPDVPGEWVLELTVTNNLGEAAADRVAIRLLQIPANHPRIYLTPAKLAILQARAVPANPRWTALLDEANDPGGDMHAKALVGILTGQADYCDLAIDAALQTASDPGNWSSKAGDIALVYDWCHHRLTTAQRATFIDYFTAWGAAEMTDPNGTDIPCWGNYWPRWGYSFALAGLAAYGDTPNAAVWLDEYRHRRFRDNDVSLLDRIAAGGAWPEGMVYDWIANCPRVMAVEAWRTAAGEDLFQSTAWFRERIPCILLHRYPGIAEQWGYPYHPYTSAGDAERNRGSMANYERIMALILLERFPGGPASGQLQAYLAAPPADSSLGFLAHEEFIWFNPAAPAAPPSLLSHFAPATGTVFIRSGWPSGAADNDNTATYLTFQCGDHFTYHQHYDQNSFTLFKAGDLAVDSGVYSGDGLSWHDVNYYVRTIAHNTLVVYNPAEDFTGARPDCSSNDGGQRPPYPASRSPQTVEYYEVHGIHYDTGDIRRFADTSRYAYVLGDAGKAYNSPVYHQSMDTGLSGNQAKVSRFQREFLYLRPASIAGGPPAPDCLVLFDRVGVTAPAFSGANTKLLFHFLNEPVVNGTAASVSPGETLHTGADLAVAQAGAGRLFLKSLLPVSRNLRVVGGRGQKAFWVFDGNYDWQWDPAEPQPRPLNDFEDNPFGEWRLELEPADDALDHNFLTVLFPAADGEESPPATELIESNGMAGVHVAVPGAGRVALFSTATDGASPGGAITYHFTPAGRILHLLFDLAPAARYGIQENAASAGTTITLSPDPAGVLVTSSQGVLEFSTGPAPGSGDLNGDGAADAADLALLAALLADNILAGIDADVPAADLDADGRLTVVDLYLLRGRLGVD